MRVGQSEIAYEPKCGADVCNDRRSGGSDVNGGSNDGVSGF